MVRSMVQFAEEFSPEKKHSLEFGKACEDLQWDHFTSRPHRSETNGIADRAVPMVKEGTFAIFLQSGLDETRWAECGKLLLSAKRS